MSGWGISPWGGGTWGVGPGTGDNLGFEDGVDGIPDFWILSSSSAWSRAEFDDGPVDTMDWFSPVLVAPAVQPAVFAGENYEPFTGWFAFITALPATSIAIFTATPYDAMDWVTFVPEFVGVGTDLTAALFDSGTEAHEDFDEGWGGTYKTSFVGVGTDLTAAVFAGNAYEDFETVSLPQLWTADPVQEEVLLVAHGLLVGDYVSFYNSGGYLPTGLLENVTYEVAVVPDPDAFRVMRVGGDPLNDVIDLQDYGIGTHYVVYDPAVYWTDGI